MAKLEQEEEFFQKWLKQRENLGYDEAQASETGRSFLNSKKKDLT